MANCIIIGMKQEGSTLVLNTWNEIDALMAGYRDADHAFTDFESDLYEARTMEVPMEEGFVRYYDRTSPEFHFRPENKDHAKQALENTLALRGLKGWRAKRSGKKEKARLILNALAVAEETQGVDS